MCSSQKKIWQFSDAQDMVFPPFSFLFLCSLVLLHTSVHLHCIRGALTRFCCEHNTVYDFAHGFCLVR
jgi:hypothetical protein